MGSFYYRTTQDEFETAFGGLMVTETRLQLFVSIWGQE